MTNPTPSASLVPLDRLKPHPSNPRRGDVEAIAESLRVNGQYRPIVVRKSDGVILAGNHTAAAAKRLGWESVSAVLVDADEATSLRILLADNRTADLAFYNEAALLDLLRSLPDLDGTGYTEADLDILDGLYKSQGGFESAAGGLLGSKRGKEDPQSDEQGEVDISIGHWAFVCESAPFEAWAADVLQSSGGSRSKAIAEVRRRLGVQETRQGKPSATGLEPSVTLTSVEQVPIADLALHPYNPREGDIGAIAESLAVNGQYRPIVANKRDGCILVGNHTAQAALQLGWTTIAVAWVDADDEAATRILLADNRTADLAGYDEDQLKQCLLALDGWAGSCFSPDDLQDLIGGGAGKAGPDTSNRVRCKIGQWRFTVKPDIWAKFIGTLPEEDRGQYPQPHSEIAHRLRLPDAWRIGEA